MIGDVMAAAKGRCVTLVCPALKYRMTNPRCAEAIFCEIGWLEWKQRHQMLNPARQLLGTARSPRPDLRGHITHTRNLAVAFRQPLMHTARKAPRIDGHKDIGGLRLDVSNRFTHAAQHHSSIGNHFKNTKQSQVSGVEQRLQTSSFHFRSTNTNDAGTTLALIIQGAHQQSPELIS